MRYPDRVTVCVSTQAGCAMACQFCATGQAGFQRAPAPRARSSSRWRWPCGRPGRGGSPTSCSWAWASRWPTTTGCGRPSTRLHGEMGLSARHLTLSTVGIVPGIRRLAAESLPVNLAVSLHAANDALRDELVPINRRYPLGVLAEACAEYVAASGRRLSIEWALIDGVNDRDSDAAELAGFARPAGRPRQPHPAQPDARATPWSGRLRTASDGFRDQLGRARGERDRAGDEGRGHRRRLRAAGRHGRPHHGVRSVGRGRGRRNDRSAAAVRLVTGPPDR